MLGEANKEVLEDTRVHSGGLVKVIKPFVFVDLSLLASLRDWKIGILSFLMIALQKDSFQILEKQLPEL